MKRKGNGESEYGKEILFLDSIFGMVVSGNIIIKDR
jgi:hypothetical protein